MGRCWGTVAPLCWQPSAEAQKYRTLPSAEFCHQQVEKKTHTKMKKLIFFGHQEGKRLLVQQGRSGWNKPSTVPAAPAASCLRAFQGAAHLSDQDWEPFPRRQSSSVPTPVPVSCRHPALLPSLLPSSSKTWQSLAKRSSSPRQPRMTRDTLSSSWFSPAKHLSKTPPCQAAPKGPPPRLLTTSGPARGHCHCSPVWDRRPDPGEAAPVQAMSCTKLKGPGQERHCLQLELCLGRAGSRKYCRNL